MYINPVEAGLVFRGEDYRYSRAIDYADGLLDGRVLFSGYSFKSGVVLEKS